MACPPNCHLCLSRNKETPVIDDSNCHCGPCTAMNEPLTLEGDIRYLKAHIETKNRQLAEKDGELAEAKLRIDIYREAWQDAERENNRLREENERLRGSVETTVDHLLAAETERNLLREKVDAYNEVDAQQVGELNDFRRENARLREENERLNTHKARYQEEILELESENDELATVLNSVRNTLIRASDDIYGKIMGD